MGLYIIPFYPPVIQPGRDSGLKIRPVPVRIWSGGLNHNNRCKIWRRTWQSLKLKSSLGTQGRELLHMLMVPYCYVNAFAAKDRRKDNLATSKANQELSGCTIGQSEHTTYIPFYCRKITGEHKTEARMRKGLTRLATQTNSRVSRRSVSHDVS